MGLRHVALFYRDRAEYRARILGFARAGLARGQPSLIAVPGDEALLLRDQFLVNHLCDLAEVRTGPGGTTVRLHMRLA